jgi:nitrate/nitrite transport system substrate-binding protein
MTSGTSIRTTRRTFLGTTGTAALLTAARAAFPYGAHAAGSGPETTKAVLGFIALTDASPLVIAKEKGLFARHGLPDVEVVKQASWGALRDNLALGSAASGIDGAHILTPLPYLMTLGKVTQNNQPVPVQILARLNLDGQGISVGDAFKELGVELDSGRLKQAFAAKKAAGQSAKAAMTFPGGTHDLWLRYWLSAGGIDPDHDVETIVVPPPQMVANMKVGTMDVFCVGEPWNEQLANQQVGFTAVTTGQLWAKHPEKSLGMRADWVEQNPGAAKALLMAVMEAQRWCDDMANKEEMCRIVGKRSWFNVPVADILARAKGDYNLGNGRTLQGSPHFQKYWQGFASYPFQSHDLWFLVESQRWGKLEAGADLKAAIAKVNREDLWREAAKELGLAAAEIPASTSRGPETFFDGKVFDPASPEAYLASLGIKRIA